MAAHWYHMGAGAKTTDSLVLFRTELCPPPNSYLEVLLVLHLVPQNMTVLGDGFFKEVKLGHYGEPKNL